MKVYLLINEAPLGDIDFLFESRGIRHIGKIISTSEKTSLSSKFTEIGSIIQEFKDEPRKETGGPQ